MCDFVICSPDIYHFHNNLDKFISLDRVIVIRNPKTLKMLDFNTHLKSFPKRKNGYVSLFVYTHYLHIFITYILPFLDPTIKYNIYLHNSDHALEHTTLYDKLLKTKYIHHIYAQNCDMNIKYKDKITLLPIGLANSMWKHGDTLALYRTMSNQYKYNKTNNIYININPSTFPYRKTILDAIEKSNSYHIVSTPKPFHEYLFELSTYRFCLCVRGNGFDTHRFWECLYLGVIPVIINNKDTNMVNFVNYINELNIPFVEIKENDVNIITTKYPDTYFNETLYKKILKECNSSIYNLPQLKLKYYD